MILNDAKILAQTLMQQHGLSGWAFRFDSARNRFGSCNYSKQNITLSAGLTELNDGAKVRDTILHEIAHALVGPRKGHGPVWKLKALEIGCNATRCYGSDVVSLPKKFTGSCNMCPFTTQRNRRTDCFHRKCKGSRIVWSKN